MSFLCKAGLRWWQRRSWGILTSESAHSAHAWGALNVTTPFRQPWVCVRCWGSSHEDVPFAVVRSDFASGSEITTATGFAQVTSEKARGCVQAHFLGVGIIFGLCLSSSASLICLPFLTQSTSVMTVLLTSVMFSNYGS